MLKTSLVFLMMVAMSIIVSGVASAESKVMINNSKTIGVGTSSNAVKINNKLRVYSNNVNNARIVNSTSGNTISTFRVNQFNNFKVTKFNRKNNILVNQINTFKYSDILINRGTKLLTSRVQKSNIKSSGIEIKRSTSSPLNNKQSSSSVLKRSTPNENSLGYIYNKALGNDSGNKRVAFREISKYAWNKVDAMNVSFCESRYSRGALNHSSIERSLGLFQVNLQAHSQAIPGNNISEKSEWLYTPSNNVRFAYKLWRDYGWRPWLNCSRKLGI